MYWTFDRASIFLHILLVSGCSTFRVTTNSIKFHIYIAGNSRYLQKSIEIQGIIQEYVISQSPIKDEKLALNQFVSKN